MAYARQELIRTSTVVTVSESVQLATTAVAKGIEDSIR